MTPDESTLEDELERGLLHCRRGRWAKGMGHLSRVADAVAAGYQAPPLFRSYYGFCLVKFKRQMREGLALCEAAVAEEFFQPEGWLNLARAALAAGDRRRAAEALAQGLSLDPESRELAALGKRMGRRQRPVLPMLSRDNPVNKLLGRARHRLTAAPAAGEPEDAALEAAVDRRRGAGR